MGAIFGGGSKTPPPPPPPPAPTVDDSAQLTDNQNQQGNVRGLGQTILTSPGGSDLDPKNTNKKTLLGGNAS